MIIQIAAVAENYAIGLEGKMQWSLSNDFKRFKQLTMGHNIIMGRKTFESLPGVLPGRAHIVITRQKDYYVPDGVIAVGSVEAALALCTYDKDVYIVGGAEIYKQTLNIADKLEITKVRSEYPGDAFFPEIRHEDWIKIFQEEHIADEKNSDNYSFVTYVRCNKNLK